MTDNLSFAEALEVIQTDRLRDSLSTHLLCACPPLENWTVVNLRNVFDVAFAIARNDLSPASIIGEVECMYWTDAIASEKLESVLLHLMSKRPHSGQTINMLEVYNISQNSGVNTEEENGLQSEPTEMHSDDGSTAESGKPFPPNDN